MATPYQNVAKAALVNWNGLSEGEAEVKIQNESVKELEEQVGAMNSIKYAVIGIAKQAGLNETETTNFFEAVVNGPEDAEIFREVANKVQGFTNEQELDVLSIIHDGWVVDNSNEKTFNKKVDRQQLRQYAPIELIGWNEVESDLLFLNPILSSVGVKVDEEQLSVAYHKRVEDYMKENNISSKEDLTNLIGHGRAYYSALPEELEAKLLPISDVVSEEIIQNWISKDSQTAEIMKSRQNDQAGSMHM